MPEPLSTLPPHLAERSRWLRAPAAPLRGDCVLYWLRAAMRVGENPALDVARCIARAHDLSLLVYQSISQRYPYASDRHHRFMLEGARDVQRQMTAAGISYCFHLETPEHREPRLLELAERAALVVTEDMPTAPAQDFLAALADRTATPIACVDSACVVPMRLTGKAFTRAFEFRDATRELYKARIPLEWPEPEAQAEPFDLERLGWRGVDLQSADLAALTGECDIDHAVAPVADTPGGSLAGYARWQQFLAAGLKHYAKRRNDALDDGVSRMSAYLHYGMVSPMRLAREARAARTGGSSKFLDELLIWRELAYGFCHYRRDHASWLALPGWARETLSAHAGDSRPARYSWEQLARAQTDDDLWNAAQLSLLRQGELHNNLRMTWGKAILNWTRSPQDALAMMIDLNHRYALDGRDPASYGGLLWCLGQFDRPFKPEQPVFGSVRQRSLAGHAKRLDVAAYRAKVAAPRFATAPSVAVIGAGIAGLMAARTLADHGIDVQVFDKGRGVGGRLATRRSEDGAQFDHGAPSFAARDQRLLRYLASWREQGVVAPWSDNVHSTGDRWVAQPGMNALCKHLARGLSVATATQVAAVARAGGALVLRDLHGTTLGSFDRLLLTAPPEQLAPLLAEVSRLAGTLSDIEMARCWAVMATFAEPLPVTWSTMRFDQDPLAWAVRNGTKPGRTAPQECLVLHATDAWTRANWDLDRAAVANELLQAFRAATGLVQPAELAVQPHRWKFAQAHGRSGPRCLFDAEAGVAVAGDWVSAPGVEGAFLSGMAAAGRLLGAL